MAAAGILGLDTSTADGAVAVTVGGELVAERSVAPNDGGRPRHATALASEIETVVIEAGGWERIGSIAVGVGPGTFTGLRIGIATARALAQGRGLSLAGVGSLAALARGIGERVPDALGLPLIDARRGELFAALYDRGGGVCAAAVRRRPRGGCRARGERPPDTACSRGWVATISRAARIRRRGGASRRGSGPPDGGAAHLRPGRRRRAGVANRCHTGLFETTRRRGMA